MKLISKVKKILWGALGVSGLLVMAHCSESKRAPETDGSRDQAKTGEDSGSVRLLLSKGNQFFLTKDMAMVQNFLSRSSILKKTQQIRVKRSLFLL